MEGYKDFSKKNAKNVPVPTSFGPENGTTTFELRSGLKACRQSMRFLMTGDTVDSGDGFPVAKLQLGQP